MEEPKLLTLMKYDMATVVAVVDPFWVPTTERERTEPKLLTWSLAWERSSSLLEIEAASWPLGHDTRTITTPCLGIAHGRGRARLK